MLFSTAFTLPISSRKIHYFRLLSKDLCVLISATSILGSSLVTHCSVSLSYFTTGLSKKNILCNFKHVFIILFSYIYLFMV